MCGSGKKRVQGKAEARAQQSTELENQRAQELHDRLTELRGLGSQFAETGGYDPEQLGRARGAIGGAISGYEDFARTGGFGEEDKTNFLRRAAAPVAAMYGRTKDELNRRLAVQGGFMPGFTSSQARLQRHAAQAGSEATLGANVELARQIREGKALGLGGQVEAGGTLGGLESNVAAGRRAGATIISDAERIGIANRLSAAGVSQAEVNSLLQLAAQKPGLFDRIKEILGMASQGIAAVGAL